MYLHPKCGWTWPVGVEPVIESTLGRSRTDPKPIDAPRPLGLFQYDSCSASLRPFIMLAHMLLKTHFASSLSCRCALYVVHLCWKYYQPHYKHCTAAIRTGLSCLRRLWLWAHAVIWCYERCYKCYEWCYKHCETCYMCCSPRCDLVPLVVLCL